MIWEIVSGLGLGEQLFGAAVLLVAAWYLLRGLSLMGSIGVAVSSGVMYVVVTAVALAAALALGWVDPRPGVVMDTVNALKATFEKFVLDIIRSAIGGAV